MSLSNFFPALLIVASLVVIWFPFLQYHWINILTGFCVVLYLVLESLKARLHDWSVRPVRAGCYSLAALPLIDSKTLYILQGTFSQRMSLWPYIFSLKHNSRSDSSDSHPTLYVVHGRAEQVLCGPYST